MIATEFIKDRYDWSSEDLERWQDFMNRLPMADFNNVIDLMTEFAKHHLEAQLDAILKQVRIKETWNNHDWESENPEGFITSEIDRESIINAYPLTNVQ